MYGITSPPLHAPDTHPLIYASTELPGYVGQLCHARVNRPGVGMGPGIWTGSTLGSSDGEKSDNSSNAGSCPMNASASSTNTSGMPRPRHIPKTSTTEEDALEKTICVACCMRTTPVFARLIGGYQNTAGDGAGSAEVGDGVGVVRRGKDASEGEDYLQGKGTALRWGC